MRTARIYRAVVPRTPLSHPTGGIAPRGQESVVLAFTRARARHRDVRPRVAIHVDGAWSKLERLKHVHGATPITEVV